jgi:hypothetical protein
MGILSRFKKVLVEAEAYYKTIGAVHCPYFNKKVTFNSDGFHHLRYKVAGSEREKSAQMYKFSLLPGAVEIVSSSGTLQQYRKQWGAVGRKKNSDGSRDMKEMEYFAFEGILGEGNSMMRIKVIVRKVGNGEPHFWSVMSDADLKRKSSYKLASDDILDQ